MLAGINSQGTNRSFFPTVTSYLRARQELPRLNLPSRLSDQRSEALRQSSEAEREDVVILVG